MKDTFKSDCLAIMALAMETPETKAHIMCGWVAHCTFFEVRVYMGGWTNAANPTLKAECHNLKAKSFTPDHHTEPAKVLAQIQALLA